MSTTAPPLAVSQEEAAQRADRWSADLTLILKSMARWAMWTSIFVVGAIGAEADLGPGRVVGFAIMAVLGFLLVSLGDGILTLLFKPGAWLLRRLGRPQAADRLLRIPYPAIGNLLAIAVFVLGDALWPQSFLGNITLALAGELLIGVMTVGGLLWALAHMNRQTPTLYWSLLAALVLLVGGYLGWVFYPGQARYLPSLPATVAAAAQTTVDLPNPGLAGPYRVTALSYGSGNNRRRPEFAGAAAWTTPTVDGSALWNFYGAPYDAYTRWLWGFDSKNLPLNALVWAPEGDGPFPLVLIVHGNHAATQPSDPGYAYLGEHLASQGYLVASVDENFLNGLLWLDGHFDEMTLRAWLLLQHLGQWRTWNSTPGHPYYGKIDLDHVALIGHSRGGEAVALAAQMNRQVVAPVNQISKPADFRFGIEAVVSIAPSDGNARLGGHPITLPHSDYLLLAGGHDADTYELYGQAQYNRISFAQNPDGFKTLAYLYQANHGQFNTVWAGNDRGYIGSLLLNRAALLDGNDQRDAAKVLIGGFLAAALRGEDGYRALFANPQAGAAWLPQTLLVTQYADAATTVIDSNRAGSLPTRLDDAGGAVVLSGFSSAETQPLLLRDGKTVQNNSALHLAWEAGTHPALTAQLSPATTVPSAGALTFALVTADEQSPPPITVTLATADGHAARLALGDFAALYPPLPAHPAKADWILPLPGYKMTFATPVEAVLQTYTLPLTAFSTDVGFDAAAIREVTFEFDSSAAGAIYLDQIGFAAAD